MSDEIPPELAKKIRWLLAAMDRGEVSPDETELAVVSQILKDHGEPWLAMECERRARRLLPNLRRDLS